MNNQMIVMLLVGVLVVAAVFQAVSLNDLSDKLGEYEDLGVTSTPSASGSQQAASPPPSTTPPAMIGGC